MVVFVSVVVCLSMTCTLPVYPCSVHCLFIHDVYIACLSMTCTLPVYPWRVHRLFIHDVYIACLSMTCILPVYPCNASCLLCTLSTYHVCISLFNHATHKNSFRHSWLFLVYFLEWLQINSKMVLYVQSSIYTTLCPSTWILEYSGYLMSAYHHLSCIMHCSTTLKPHAQEILCLSNDAQKELTWLCSLYQLM